MKEYSYRQSPMELHGVPFFDKFGRLERLPDWLRQQLPNLDFLGRRCPGARVCFRTNSRHVKVKVVYETLSPDIGMSLYSCQSAYVYIGERTKARYAGLVFPKEGYNSRFAERTFEKSGEVEDVTIWLPRNEVIAGLGFFAAALLKTLITGDLGDWWMANVFGIFCLVCAVYRMVRLRLEIIAMKEAEQELDEQTAAAIEQVPAAIVAGNTVEVDGVTGATMTSTRIMKAVAACLEQAATYAADISN